MYLRSQIAQRMRDHPMPGSSGQRLEITPRMTADEETIQMPGSR
jgi:hypothetical protein